jgi:hypothetical protein
VRLVLSDWLAGYLLHASAVIGVEGNGYFFDKFHIDKASVVGRKVRKSMPFYLYRFTRDQKDILVGKGLLKRDIILGLPDDYRSVIVSNKERSIHVCGSRDGAEQLPENVIFR